MIIVQVITTLVYGGAERLLVNFTNVLAGEHEIHIIYLKGDPKLKPAIDERIKVHHIPLGLSCASRLRKLIKQLKPDVVHTHLGHADLIGLWASRGLRVKTFCTMHNVYFKWNWVDRIIFFAYWVTFKLHGRNCKVTCISKAVALHVEKTLGVKKENISVVYNAIPDLISTTPKIRARAELSLSPDDFIILTIGRLRVQKSIDTLLLATATLAAQIRNLQVLIVGEGPLEEELKSRSGQLGISSFVRFCGSTNTPETYYAAADVFVLPSVFEGLPTVILEAFRSSLPVVASNIDGNTELIQHGVNGQLFPPREPTALAAEVFSLYNSPERLMSIAREGHASYKQRFEIHKYAVAMEAIYSK